MFEKNTARLTIKMSVDYKHTSVITCLWVSPFTLSHLALMSAVEPYINSNCTEYTQL